MRGGLGHIPTFHIHLQLAEADTLCILAVEGRISSNMIILILKKLS